jgi:hypothetical protein
MPLASASSSTSGSDRHEQTLAFALTTLPKAFETSIPAGAGIRLSRNRIFEEGSGSPGDQGPRL